MELDNDFDKLTIVLKRLLLQVKVHTCTHHSGVKCVCVCVCVWSLRAPLKFNDV